MKNLFYAFVLLLCGLCSTTAQTVNWTKFQSYGDHAFDMYIVPQTSLIYVNAIYSSIALLDTKTGEIVNQYKNIYKPHSDWWRSGYVVAVNSKNAYMISQQWDTLIKWNVKGNDSILQRRKIAGNAISSGDGEKVFYDTLKNADRDDIVVLESENLQEIGRFPLSKDRQKLIVNKNGSLMAYITKSNERKLVVVSTETGQVVNTITVDFELHSLRFSIDGESIISYHIGKLARHKTIGSGTTEEIFPYRNYGDLSPDEKYIAYNGNGGIVLYNLQTKTNEIIPVGDENYSIFPPVRFNGDGSSVLIGGLNIIVVDVINKKLSHTLTIPEVLSIHLFNRNKALHVSCRGFVPNYVLDTKNGNYIAKGSGIGSRNSPISVIPLAKTSSDEKNKLFYRNVETGYYFSKELDYKPHNQRTMISDNGKLIAAASSDSQTVIVHNTEDLEEIFRIKLDLLEQDNMKLEMVRYLQFIDNDNLLGIVTDRNYFVLSVNEKKIVKKIISNNFVPYSYILKRYISDDGKYLLTFSAGDNLTVLDTESGNTSLVWNHKEHPKVYFIPMLKWIDNTTFGLFMDTQYSNNDTLFVIRYDGAIAESYPIATNNEYLWDESVFDCIFDKDSIAMFLSVTPRRFTSLTQRRVVSSVVDADVFDNHSVNTYPQPSNDEVTVELSHDDKAYSMSVHTLAGEQVLHELFEPTSIFTFSTKNIVNGMFIMRVALDNGESLTKPLHVIH